MKRWRVQLAAGLLGLIVSAAPARADLFFNICSPGSFKVCASADIAIGPGNTLVMKVWNMNQSTFATASVADYGSEFGGWHTIRAVGVTNIGYTLTGMGTTVVAKYFDGTTWTTLSQWAGAADAESLQVYNTGSDTDGHKEGIVGCLDPGPANAAHVSTCNTYPSAPFVQFTISGFATLDLTDAVFEYQGVQGAFPDCDPTQQATGRNGTEFVDQRCTDNSFKGTGSVVPEPITIVLLASGLFGVGGVARRRRRDTISAA